MDVSEITRRQRNFLDTVIEEVDAKRTKKMSKYLRHSSSDYGFTHAACHYYRSLPRIRNASDACLDIAQAAVASCRSRQLEDQETYAGGEGVDSGHVNKSVLDGFRVHHGQKWNMKNDIFSNLGGGTIHLPSLNQNDFKDCFTNERADLHVRDFNLRRELNTRRNATEKESISNGSNIPSTRLHTKQFNVLNERVGLALSKFQQKTGGHNTDNNEIDEKKEKDVLKRRRKKLVTPLLGNVIKQSGDSSLTPLELKLASTGNRNYVVQGETALINSHSQSALTHKDISSKSINLLHRAPGRMQNSDKPSAKRRGLKKVSISDLETIEEFKVSSRFHTSGESVKGSMSSKHSGAEMDSIQRMEDRKKVKFQSEGETTVGKVKFSLSSDSDDSEEEKGVNKENFEWWESERRISITEENKPICFAAMEQDCKSPLAADNKKVLKVVPPRGKEKRQKVHRRHSTSVLPLAIDKADGNSVRADTEPNLSPLEMSRHRSLSSATWQTGRRASMGSEAEESDLYEMSSSTRLSILETSFAKKCSISSKVNNWKTNYEEQQEVISEAGVRHSMSVPTMLSAWPRRHSKQLGDNNQYRHFMLQQQQQNQQHRTSLYQQQQHGSNRRPFRKLSMSRVLNGELAIPLRPERKDNPRFQCGIRKVFRKTRSHGDLGQLPFVKSFMPLVKFRRAVNMILLLLRATYNSRERTQRRERQFNHWITMSESFGTTSRRAYDTYDISFDPDDFKTNREIQVSAEAKAILSLEPGQRSAQQLHIALVSLRQAVPEFSEFPITMQKSLVRVGWYEHFEAKRVIIRQGHLADNFYLILNGKAVVVMYDTDKRGEQTAQTAAFLGKGKSFGELALMHKSRRSATVTCKDDVELLAVSRDDFVDIFMHVDGDNEPEHVRFLRSLHIIRDWPFHLLPFDNPEILVFTYVRRGVVLCRDSKHSEWIYVVKSGSCRVIKALRAAQAGVHGNQWKGVKDSHEQKSSHTGPVHKPSVLPSPLTLHREDTNVKKNQKRKIKKKRDNKEQTLLSKGPEEPQQTTLEHLQTLDAILARKHPPELEPESQKDVENETSNVPDASVNKAETVFVQVLNLGPRDIYGLESSLFDNMKDTMSTSLVSEGAEVIMVNRKFFLDNTSEDMRKRIRKEIQPLPSEEHLQSRLRNMVNWEAFRVRTLKKTIDFKKIGS